jgi:uncharacterized secreted protein with C-terminal beta-propeller domain
MDDRLTTILAIATVALLVGTAFGAGAAGLIEPPGSTDDERVSGYADDWPDDEPGLETFESATAFEAYFEAAERANTPWGSSRTQLSGGTDDSVDVATEAPEATPTASAAGDEAEYDTSDGSERHSETNVQEAALDEPDVLKTDGDSVYYAGHHFQRGAHETSVLDLDDPADPEVVATLPAAGELLLVEETDTLVVFDDDRLWGYDVSDPSNPEQIWDERLDATLQTARLHDGTLYLVLVDRPDHGGDPCPLAPYGDEPIECTDVYRPNANSDADAVYTAARIDLATGELEDETSVVGSVRDSATYVSKNAIYLSYTRSSSEFDLLTGYLTGPGTKHLDPATVERIENLETLDISERAKSVELREIMEDWLDSLEDDKRREAQRDLQEGLEEYAEERKRELVKTGIVRISIDGDLDATASGEVPGYPMNQWSMDEHKDHLRIATTIPGAHGADSENDVYVLDSDLDVTGSVQGLGETERIYAVRFEGDEGYVVTFREIDPFYTLDLADPANPRMEGELKIPGFSTYIHPLDDEGDLVLGVGEEEGKVKLSTFDVSDRTDPVELDAKILENERFSEANRNHRAFLHDERHGVFFLPAGEYSYVFSYEDGELEEEARIDVGGPGVRSMYVDDYLYVFGPEEVVVLDETTWEIETRIDAR